MVAAGPWIRDVWAWLDLPETITVAGPGGTSEAGRPMWTYWALQEGTLGIKPTEFTDNRGDFPPVTHVDSAEPLIDDITGDLITDKLWGIYYKPDFNFAGLQGGAAPNVVDKPAGAIAIDPYGPDSPEYTVADAKIVILVTRWEEFLQLADLLNELDQSPLVVDGRRMLDPESLAHYEGIGR